MIILLLIIAFFCPFVLIGSITFPISYLIISVIAIIGLTKIVKSKKHIEILVFFLIYFFFSVLIASFHAFYNNYIDFRGVSGAIIGIIALGSSVFISDRLIKYKITNVVSLVNYPLFINNLIILLLFNSENFRKLFYGLISVNKRMFDYPVPRYSGLIFDGFSYASTLNAIYFLIIFYLITTYYKLINTKTKIFVVFNLILAVITTILVGRTGTGIIIFGIFLFIFYDFIFGSLTKKITIFFKSIYLFIFGIIISFIIYNIVSNFNFFENLVYGFKFYSDAFETGQINDSSVEDIQKNMFFLPDGIFQSIFGIGNFGRGLKYIPSDLGFILGIHGYGLLGIIFFILCLFSFLLLNISKKTKINNVFKFITIGSIFIFLNLKDYYLFYPIGHYTLFFTFIMYIKLYESNRDR